MKKIILLLLAVCCLFTACKASQDPAGSTAAAETGTQATSQAPEESTAATESAADSITVSPIPSAMDPEHPDNCTAAVSLKKGDAYVDDDGIMQMKVTIYSYDLYDMADIARLKEGDTIIIRQQTVTVSSLERDGDNAVLINGGSEAGGYTLRTDGDTVYHEADPSNEKVWQELGSATLRVSGDFEYIDSSDPDKDPVTYYPGDFLIDNSDIDYDFTPDTTSIVIESGYVIAMNRIPGSS